MRIKITGNFQNYLTEPQTVPVHCASRTETHSDYALTHPLHRRWMFHDS
jgi:hypothetical protein